ncbi:MAG: hypothetical protein AAFS11_10530 [Planctomycetota bacterium]
MDTNGDAMVAKAALPILGISVDCPAPTDLHFVVTSRSHSVHHHATAHEAAGVVMD